MDGIEGSTFRFTIENIRRLTQVFSPPTFLRKYSWKIEVILKTEISPSRKFLGCFIHCDGEGDSSTWNCSAIANLKLISQKAGCANYCKSVERHEFNSKESLGYGQFIEWSILLNPTQGLVKNDSITFEVEVILDIPSEAQRDKLEKFKLNESILMVDFGKMLEDTESHDVKIQCLGVQLSAHKIILSCRSPVFGAMFRSGMKESNESSIEVKDVSPGAVKVLLRWIYTSQMRVKDEPYALDLLKLADMYQLPSLVDTCQAVLIGQIKNENIVDILVLADLVDAKQLKRAAFNFITKNKSIVNSVEFKNKVSKELFADIFIMSIEKVNIVPHYTHRLP